MLSRGFRKNVKPNLTKGSSRGNQSGETDSGDPPSTSQNSDVLIRRERLQIKPNLANGSKLESNSTAKESVEASPSTCQHTEATTAHHDSGNHVDQVPEAHTAPEVPISIEISPLRKMDVPYGSPQSSIVLDDRGSTRTDHSPTGRKKKPKRKFTGEEELDPKKMRMVDLVYWNPKKEQGMSHHRADNESIIGEEASTRSKTQSTANKVAAPQVKIGPDGRLVIDEESLVIAETTTNSVWETINEDRVSRKVTSLSFRKRAYRKSITWTEKETELFYEILRCTGPDFGLMHEFYPTRARHELKSKFNREERTNWAKLKEVLSKPALLDDDLYARAAHIQKEIEKEALAKQTKNEKDKDVKVIPKKRGARKRKTLDAETERPNESDDVVVESSSESSHETVNGTDVSSGLHGMSRRSSVPNTSEVETVIGEPERTRVPRKLSARAQQLLDRTVKSSKSIGTHQNEKVDENDRKAREVLPGYDEEDDDLSDGERDHTHSSPSPHVRKGRNDEITMNIKNEHNSLQTRVCTFRDTAQDSSQNVLCDRSEVDSLISDEASFPAGTSVARKYDVNESPSLLIRPPAKRSLFLRTAQEVRPSVVIGSETDQLHKRSKFSESNSKLSNGSCDSGTSHHDSGMLTRSSRIRKPKPVFESLR
ncbi:hypothetical protein KIN20_006448 [Parelaphostrongylus tenuis]|uniref:Transcription factor TFIIIB component B'' Myb domain-containing protein n=1 Tax=Parelaphostrongylus tenuis TaxID=148309 RepID=A0AAD5M4S5_PARTN|nr:hypothetical protein KIN20_006448 [Parelaphostrongylus tenuis]